MNDKNVKSVAGDNLTFHVENIACRTHALDKGDGDGFVTNRTKRRRLIDKGHIDASLVGRLGHQIVVAGISQERTTGEVMEHSVILYLNKCHEVRQLLATRENGLPRMVQLAPVARASPMARTFRQILIILLQRIVATIEKILTIQLDKGQLLG